jgi:glucosamine-6-phosphate deaminase
MGGMLRKLAENENRVTVAYQTSGNIAVFDHEVRRYLDFSKRASEAVGLGEPGVVNELSGRIHQNLSGKDPGDIDIDDVQALKRIIRETEAIAGLEASGLSASSGRFLNLPFYQTGKVKKDPISSADVDIVLELLEEKRPSIIFAAGDLSDPHGTHRMCLEAVEAALSLFEGDPPELWLYRGAWQEWNVNEATVLVPLSEEELRKKIQAIFKHESQKDSAPFPGPDPREFWQRVVDRNRGTAELLRALGLPAYYAMEAYVALRDGVPTETPHVATALLGEGVS